ncbi:hypothetical protein HH214_14265 [Mucilaginibacter robiniae]|uniref:Uncharacterized protein n=1 Tax=Mucilaginibacter robiniae TaxID=2728022 RepID=A0A7L5E3T9_9SPHI|nr:hypothetical protein [Mucilaginibacter robiniae]QJD96949.1 hypothetical protein HH214_14265 [Mucilaginibacter robiniae]
MSSVICTLFENRYHYGVAALINSLYKQGFRGDIYAGYKGDLPAWAKAAQEVNSSWIGSRTLKVTESLQLHFLPLTTDYHLTNYKPDFMLSLLDGPAKQANCLYYFDPDITVIAPWKFIERWAEGGVAVCEDVNSPLPQHHPHRVAWRKTFKDAGIYLNFKEAFYANGGYLGLCKRDFAFLNVWKAVQEAMGEHIGGLNRSIFKSYAALAPDAQGPFAPFGRTDQDALNAAMEAWDGSVSLIGKEAMAFIPGGAIMPHALGSPKPWDWKPLSRAFSGRPPRIMERKYWESAQGPINLYSNRTIVYKKFSISIAALIGRFYKRA